MDLTDYRKKIDAIDDQLVRLFQQRMDVAAEIAAYKQAQGLPVLDASREQQKLRDLCAKARPEMQPYLQELYTTIFAVSRAYQRSMGLKCGLLGRKLGHSYSPQIHRQLAEYEYKLYEKEPKELADFLKHGNFHGMNVTIPYKKAVVPHCDLLAPLAKELGSVNTLVRLGDGRLLGENTDAWGFDQMLGRVGIDCAGKKALVLGSGGASATVQAILRLAGAEVVVISRTGKNNYDNLDRHADARILVNTTPVGMYPHNGQTPVDLDRLPQLEAVLDLIYNPTRTRLILDAQARGIPCESGLYMLVAQAVHACELWTEQTISTEKMEQVWKRTAADMENIILVGMPGSGKTTVGTALAKALGREFLDADAVFTERFGPCADVISNAGEDTFRKLETEVLSDLGRRSGMVFSTGGGCVTRPENRDLLRQNGTVIWLRRDLDKLPTIGRPLSQQYGTEALYAQRKPLYELFSDCTVDNNGTVAETLAQILALL